MGRRAAGQQGRQRRLWLTVPLVLLAIAAAFVLMRLQPWNQVDVPPDSASAEEVVAAFVAARNAHDTGTMRALLIDDGSVPSLVDVLMGRTTQFDDVVIKSPTGWDTRGTNLGQWNQVTHVPIEMTVENGPASGFSDGRQQWGYVLVRNSDSEPWRIADQGVV